MEMVSVGPKRQENFLGFLFGWPRAEVVTETQRREMLAEVWKIVLGMKYSHREVLRLYYSLDGNYSYSNKQLATIFKLTPARFKRILASAIGILVRRFLANHK